MALSKKETRKILLNHLRGGDLTRKELVIQYLASFTICLFVLPIYIFLIKVMPISRHDIMKHVFSFLVFGIVAVLIIYCLIFRARKSGRANLELARLENQQEKKAKKIIIGNLGKQIFLNLNPVANSLNVNQTDLCAEILNQDEVKNNSELSFYLKLKIYWFYFIEGDFMQAIKALKSALKIYPTDIITNVRLAEAHELLGNGDKAIDIYRTIMDFLSISSNLKEYIGKQIERVRSEGPKKAPPIPGLRYMTF